MKPLFTIAIPTYNRANYLKANLDQLRNELVSVNQGLIEVIVSDNCSTDNTREVVSELISQGMEIIYTRNEKNLGWGRNFLQCFTLAKGKYVLLLGDDDLIYDKGLSLIVNNMMNGEYGIICVHPYGFDNDFRRESPGLYGSIRSYSDFNEFLYAISPIMRSISACIINKDLINHIDFEKYPIGNFAHLHLVMNAILLSDRNLYINKYIVACKRNNSVGYNFSEIFVKEYWGLIDVYLNGKLPVKTVRRLENQMLLTYYPYYVLFERKNNMKEIDKTRNIFNERFKGRFLYNCWVKPTLIWPTFLAISWGYFTTLVGRSLNGELIRGLVFLWKTKLFKKN